MSDKNRPELTLPGCQVRSDASADSVSVCVMTVSDTRDLSNDVGGKVICELLEQNQHAVSDRVIVPDQKAEIRQQVSDWCRDGIPAILVTGGTGLAKRDVTPEAIEPMYARTIPGYGELFRMLSFEQVGAAAMLSRASAGQIGNTIVFTMPGSPKGVQLAMEKLILPELAHITEHAGG